MTREENIRAILECNFAGFKDEIIDNAVKRICEIEQGPKFMIKADGTIEPIIKIGHWIRQTLSVKPFGEDTVLCDQCAFMTDKDNTYNYCPKCGARMSEVSE